MKKIIAIFLTGVILLTTTPSASATYTMEIDNSSLEYQSKELFNGTTYHEISDKDINFHSEIYEYYDEDVLVYEIYENEKHDIVKVLSENVIEVNGEIITIERNVNSVMQKSPRAIWLRNYGTSSFGGSKDDYEYVNTSVVNLMQSSAEGLANFATGSLATIIATAAKLDLKTSLAMGFFMYAAGEIKQVHEYADEGNVYLSFSHAVYTNHNLNTPLAKYYLHKFEFYSKQNCTGTHIVTNTPVYEIYHMV